MQTKEFDEPLIISFSQQKCSSLVKTAPIMLASMII